MQIENQDDQLMVMAAFRYCLGRQSYIVGTCEEWLRRHWDQIDPHIQSLIRSEILDALTKGIAGDLCDVAVWAGFADWIDRQIARQ